MGRIAVHGFVTLDGVIEGRAHREFASAWTGRSVEDDRGAPFMHESPKYVVSGTLESAGRDNSTILGPYDQDAIRSLRISSSAVAHLTYRPTCSAATVSSTPASSQEIHPAASS
jgi:hypothetical protein